MRRDRILSVVTLVIAIVSIALAFTVFASGWRQYLWWFNAGCFLFSTVNLWRADKLEQQLRVKRAEFNRLIDEMTPAQRDALLTEIEEQRRKDIVEGKK